MCRSIKTLRRADEPATEEEIRAAALQFVRKVSGYRVPAARNAEAFDSAVDEITAASQRLLGGLIAVGGSRRAESAPHDHGDGVVHSHAAG
jgi:hypothetical protein